MKTLRKHVETSEILPTIPLKYNLQVRQQTRNSLSLSGRIALRTYLCRRARLVKSHHTGVRPRPPSMALPAGAADRDDLVHLRARPPRPAPLV